MYVSILKDERYEQLCTVVSSKFGYAVKSEYFTVDTGACYTCCPCDCVNFDLEESDLKGKAYETVFYGYVKEGNTFGAVHYEYEVDDFLVGGISLGKQKIYVTFDERINANLLGMNLLKELILLQLTDKGIGETITKLYMFNSDNDFIQYLIKSPEIVSQILSSGEINTAIGQIAVQYVIRQPELLTQILSSKSFDTVTRRKLIECLFTHMNESCSDFLDLAYGFMNSVKMRVKDKSELDRLADFIKSPDVF